MKKNPFNAGDIVRVYHANGSHKGEVSYTFDDKVVISGSSTRFHFKQCRRLKKQREVWLAPKYEDVLRLNPSVSNYKIQGWIRFVAVKK